MDSTFQKKSDEIRKKFISLSSMEARYEALIELGKNIPPYPENLKTPDKIVSGCQSTLYLNAFVENEKIYFQASSDALISAGLAALLLTVYNGETPETVLTSPPHFLQDLGLMSQLSPSRSNGLAHIHLRMKQLSLQFLSLKS